MSLAVFAFLLLLPAAPLRAQDTNIIGRIFERQKALESAIRDAVYTGESRSLELDGNGTVKRETVARRRIWMKGDLERSEYFYLKVNGRELTPEEIRKETAKWGGGRGGRDGMRDRLPFMPETSGAYSYRVREKRKRDGLDVWVVHFEAVKKEIGYLTGDAYILDGEYEIVGLDFVPAKTHFAVKNMKFSMNYAKTAGFWLLSGFSMEVEIELKALVEFAHVVVRVSEEYRDYRINTGLPDSVFDAKK